MKRLLALIVLPLAVWAFGLPAASATPFNAAQVEAAIDAFAEAVLEGRQTPGLAVAVARAGEPVWVRGYGYANLEHGVPVGEDTVFRIGSVTKQFTAAAILLLAEEGRLSLDDTVEAYFPDFPRAEDITIRQLLQHTAGISNYTSRDGFMADTAPLHHDRERMLAYIAAADPLYDFEPGTGWSYSNSGYILLDYIVEDAAGQPLADFLREQIFNPLGLNDTRMDDAAEILARRAQGYDAAEDAPSGFTNTAHLSLSVAAGAGAMRSTARDLALWMQALLDGEVVTPASLALMLEPARLNDGSLASSALENPPAALAGMDYGLGIMTGERDGRRFIGHGGSINGFNASLIQYPDEATTIVLLVNTIGPAARGAPVLAGAVLGEAAE